MCIALLYGPDTSEKVQVAEYAPAAAFAGTARLKTGVTVWSPMPVPTAAEKSAVAGGALVPAGRT